MSAKPLREKLQALQCHFTWHLEVNDPVDVAHVLKTLALQVEHTPYRVRSTYLAMRAYMHHLQGAYQKALGDLSEAADVLTEEHPTNFSRQALLVYGNSAWIYYLLANYSRAEHYLSRIRDICQSLSSPEPYSAQLPEIHAQRGWSLLVLGFQNGEEARACFQTAVRGDGSNRDFQAGLAISVFASWSHSRGSGLRGEAVRLIEETLRNQPENWDAKLYQAILLQSTSLRRATQLLEEVSRGTLDPEVLRNAARLCQPHSLSGAIALLQQAIGLAPGYHRLHYDLGVCYTNQLEGAALEKRREILAAAVQSFQRAVEEDPRSVFPKLELAKIYRGKNPLYAEEIYLNLLEELPVASKRGQQAIYRHWGDFLLRGKGQRQKALEAYRAGCAILGGCPRERRQLMERVAELTEAPGEDPARDLAGAVQEILQLQPEP